MHREQPRSRRGRAAAGTGEDSLVGEPVRVVTGGDQQRGLGVGTDAQVGVPGSRVYVASQAWLAPPAAR